MNKIMILGTFHMEGSCDVYGEKQEGISTERRQKEIQELVDRIKKFDPTVIAVEVEKRANELLQEKYNAYWESNVLERENEVWQIGFRLAKQLGHKKVVGVDWMEEGVSQRGCGDVLTYLEEKEPELCVELKRYIGAVVKLDEKTTILDTYRKMNSKEEFEKSLAYYVNYARIGSAEDYYGLGWLLWWYQRNLIIFANISELVRKDSDERVLLLIGAAHRGILTEMLADSRLFEVVDVLEYLEEGE